jgi:hypothetical protein
MRGGMDKDVQPGMGMGGGTGFGRWPGMRPGGGRGFRPDHVPDADKLSAPESGDNEADKPSTPEGGDKKEAAKPEGEQS